MRRLTLFWIVVALGACSTDDGAVDRDAAATMDAAAIDTGSPRPDGGPVSRDAGPPPPRFEGLPVSCWLPPNSVCNPANNDGCAADEACDVALDAEGRPIVTCFPPPATQELGETCNNEGGPFCVGGLRCMDGECMDTCCTDAECAAPGERCIALEPDLGSLGVCDDASTPSCQPPGAFCRSSSDCCSSDCHVGHCH